MFIIGIIFCIVAVVLLCLLLVLLAVQALPLFVGAAVGIFAYRHGASAAPAVVVALTAGALAHILTQFAFDRARLPIIRSAIALLVTAPATFAGYHATLGIARITLPAGAPRQELALLGSLVIGGIAFARLHARTSRRGIRPARANDYCEAESYTRHAPS